MWIMREIIYDTETTGKRFQDGHRVVEVAAIELVDGVPTGKEFYSLVNPERDIPDEVVAIHGITNAKVANAPTFKQIMPQLIEFFQGAKAIAHNSEFDEKFLNNELVLAGHPESFWGIVSDTDDTIRISRKIWVGKDEAGNNYKHSLDAVLDRCQIDRSDRTLHGALIDSRLLATAYAHLQQRLADMGPTLEDDAPRGPIARVQLKGNLPKVEVLDIHMQQHQEIMDALRPRAAAPKP